MFESWFATSNISDPTRAISRGVRPAPYFTNAFLLLRAAGCFGEAARNQRNEKTRIALLYERNFGYEGRFSRR